MKRTAQARGLADHRSETAKWFAFRIDEWGSAAFAVVVLATLLAIGFTKGVVAIALVGGLFVSALAVVVLTERLGN